jgi:hypothetical protein
MTKKDEDVAAVWQVILNGGAEGLADESLEYQAFATIIKFGARIGLAKNAIAIF